MYVGHAAIALALKSRRPETAMLPLVLAAYGPDWLEVPFMIPHPHGPMAMFSHSLLAIAVGALLAALVYRLVVRRPGAMVILTGWLLHWPADLLTGRKPLFDERHLVGLDLYRLPIIDFALEGVVIAVACYLYSRAMARTPGQRRLVVALAVLLLLLQAGMDFSFTWVTARVTQMAVAQSR
jgi:hypothetical protein